MTGSRRTIGTPILNMYADKLGHCYNVKARYNRAKICFKVTERKVLVQEKNQHVLGPELDLEVVE